MLKPEEIRENTKDGLNLRRAYLRRAYLTGANLRRANLTGANLTGANLTGAYLGGADLRGANLTGANLTGADLGGAYLGGANLRGANLTGANLGGAYLGGADLRGADLHGADLTDAKLPHFQISQEGTLTVYKKVDTGVITLLVPAKARRTASLVGRKCRAEFVEVLKGSGMSTHGGVYTEGTIYHPDKYDDDIRVECTHGVHFFLTREEAEEWPG